MPRIFDSEIYIDTHDKWIFRGNEITKEEILHYFRSNLVSSNDGVYIYNTFGDLSEHGYIQIYGFPCHILHVEWEDEQLIFYTDDGKELPFGLLEIYESETYGIIALDPTKEKIKYRFNWNAAKDLSKYLIEDDSGIYLELNGEKIAIPKWEGEITVPLPHTFGN